MDAIQEFDLFAIDKMRNHFSELQTRYNNEAVADDIISEAYKAHASTFRQELEEKIKELVGKGHPWLEAELNTRRKGFEQRFQDSQKSDVVADMNNESTAKQEIHFEKRDLNEDEEY
jgi:hypothetical protein